MTVRRPLLVALPAALAGFGGWLWLTGPGTDVPNALIAFVVGVICGRAAWWLVAPRGAADPRPAALPTREWGGRE